MTYSINAGIQISTDNATWYALTDHNRSPINYTPDITEKSARMSDGTMRKYVIANKARFDTAWTFVPASSKTITTFGGKTVPSFQPTVDGNYGAAFLKAFYQQYVFTPVYIKIVNATDNYTGNAFYSSQQGSNNIAPSDGIGSGVEIHRVFITDFSYTVIKRFTYTDYVDVKIQFTEV